MLDTKTYTTVAPITRRTKPRKTFKPRTRPTNPPTTIMPTSLTSPKPTEQATTSESTKTTRPKMSLITKVFEEDEDGSESEYEDSDQTRFNISKPDSSEPIYDYEQDYNYSPESDNNPVITEEIPMEFNLIDFDPGTMLSNLG